MYRNHTIIITHFPLNTVYSSLSSDGLTFREIISKYNVSMYLCGHLHGVLPYLQTPHLTGPYLEMEVSNFMNSYKYFFFLIFIF